MEENVDKFNSRIVENVGTEIEVDFNLHREIEQVDIIGNSCVCVLQHAEITYF